MGKKTYITQSDTETQLLAKKIIKSLLPLVKEKPAVIFLYGTLGVGKTTFVKGIGASLGIENITSPTFVLIHEYPLTGMTKKFYHVDLYRIRDNNEFLHLGIEESLKPNTITCVEWSEHAGPIMQLFASHAYIIKILIKHINKTKRLIEIDSGVV